MKEKRLEAAKIAAKQYANGLRELRNLDDATSALAEAAFLNGEMEIFSELSDAKVKIDALESEREILCRTCEGLMEQASRFAASMTAPTTHDTRTPLFTDDMIENHVNKDWTTAECDRFDDGVVVARSIYEPHVAKLEAEIAALKAMVPVWVEHGSGDRSRLQLDGWKCVLNSNPHSSAEPLRWLMVPPIPLPAAPTQGGGEG